MWRVISSRRDFLLVLFVLSFLSLFPARHGPLSYHDRTSVALPPAPISPQPMCHGVVSRPGRSSVAAGSPQRDFGCGQGRKKDPLFVLSRKKQAPRILSEAPFPKCFSQARTGAASAARDRTSHLTFFINTPDHGPILLTKSALKLAQKLVHFWFSFGSTLTPRYGSMKTLFRVHFRPFLRAFSGLIYGPEKRALTRGLKLF